MARTKTTKKISKLFGASAYDGAPAKNYEGAPTFTRGPEESLVRVLTTGTFEPTYYASDVTLADEALELFRSFAADDPHFLAQAILYARNEGLMRIAPSPRWWCSRPAPASTPRRRSVASSRASSRHLATCRTLSPFAAAASCAGRGRP